MRKVSNNLPTKSQYIARGAGKQGQNRPIQGPNKLPPVLAEPPDNALNEVGKEEWKRVVAIQNGLGEGDHWITIADVGSLLVYCAAFQNFVEASVAVQERRTKATKNGWSDDFDELDRLIIIQERRAKRYEAAATALSLSPRARQRMNIVMFNDIKLSNGENKSGRLFLG